MIHVNSVTEALRATLAADPIFTNSAYPIDVGEGWSRHGNVQYWISIWPFGIELEPRTIQPEPEGWRAEVQVVVFHGAYTATFSGAALDMLMRAQKQIFLAVNSDIRLGGAVEKLDSISSQLVEHDETIDENAIVNQITLTYNVRGSS